jgi:hypothetical protein
MRRERTHEEGSLAVARFRESWARAHADQSRVERLVAEIEAVTAELRNRTDRMMEDFAVILDRQEPD